MWSSNHNVQIIILECQSRAKFQDGGTSETQSALWGFAKRTAEELGNKKVCFSVQGSSGFQKVFALGTKRQKMAEVSSVRTEHKFDENSLHEYLKKNLPGFPKGQGCLSVSQYRFVML